MQAVMAIPKIPKFVRFIRMVPTVLLAGLMRYPTTARVRQMIHITPKHMATRGYTTPTVKIKKTNKVICSRKFL